MRGESMTRAWLGGLVVWLLCASGSAEGTLDVPAHNRPDLQVPPPRPELGNAQDKARRLFEAIRDDRPELAADFFFPKDAFVVLKKGPDPARYWERLAARYRADIHALHRAHPELGDATFERLELSRRGGFVGVGEEGNHLPYWASRHSSLYYRVGKRARAIEVRVMITWDDCWYITHLSEFH
jgi:hypothetical protein